MPQDTTDVLGRRIGAALVLLALLIVLGIRVVGLDGAPIGLGRAAVRTLLRVVDGLPFFYLVGFVTVLATGTKRQRIGDLAVRSHVVRQG